MNDVRIRLLDGRIITVRDEDAYEMVTEGLATYVDFVDP